MKPRRPELHITPRGKRGTLWVSFRLPDGTRIRESARTTDSRSARKHGEQLMDRLLAGGERHALTLKEACEKAWREHYKYTQGAKMHRLNMKLVREILGDGTPMVSIDETKLGELVAKLREKGNSGATINRKLSTLQKVIRLSIQNRWEVGLRMPYIPRQPEGQHRIRTMSKAEERNLFSYLRTDKVEDAEDVFTVKLDTGMRLGELLNVTRPRVDFENKAVYAQSKRGHPRWVPLTNRAAAILRRKALAAGFDEGGSRRALFPKHCKTYQRAWDRAKKAMGLTTDRQFVPHVCRHTCATRLLQSGAMSIYDVKEWLGHSSVKVTEKYLHLDHNRLRRGAKALEEAQ